jgi:hypothetical protein
MGKRRVLLISPTRHSIWQIVLEGEERLFEERDKEAACAAANDWAMANAPCIVRLLNLDGSVEREWRVEAERT